jgi:dihydroorotate dehydrogenase
MVNWDGWSNVGVCEVAKRLSSYGDHGVPLTLSLGPTPGISYTHELKDLEKSVLTTRGLFGVDRYELNVSCSNVDNSFVGLEDLFQRSRVIRDNSCHDLYLKVSPDLSEDEVCEIAAAGEEIGVDGYVVSNTTKFHPRSHIPFYPGRGVASGDVVYDFSKSVQRYFANVVGDKKIVACGGIDSVNRVDERLGIGNCNEIQIYTPLVMKGTRLLRELRKG